MNFLLLQLRNYTKFSRKTVCFGLYIDKTCVPAVFSESPLNTDTMACPLVVRINRVPLYFGVVLARKSGVEP